MIRPFACVMTLAVLSSAPGAAQAPTQGGAAPSPQAPIPQASAAPADAPMEDAVARARFASGRVLYDAGRFLEAARDFEEAYRLSGRPALLYNIYVAYRDANDFPKAIDALRSYLGLVPDAADRENLAARLASMEATVAERSAAAEREARAREDAEAARARADRTRAPNVLPWIVASVGAAALVGGGVTGVLALDRVGEIEDACPNDVCARGYDLEAARDRASTLVRTTDWLLLAGSVLVAGGLAWWLVDSPTDEERPVATPAAACDAAGCFTSVQVRY